ncbi:tetratricopeptide repeat protein [Rhodopila sp.]|uniref:tetratricopeptide repeat protein n=1 Tax=Rhodopila sp. TaxID=2480087 RepID=UPI003D0BE2B4
MPPLEPPEKSGNEVPYPQGGSFADLLSWHLDFGTRPQGSPDRPGRRWGNKDFAVALSGINERTVRNWRAGRNPPTELGSIERELFGDNDAYDQWCIDLRAAYDGRRQPPPTSSIPRPPAYFLGRVKDVAAILDVLLSSSASVAILVQGGPGIGKTSLTQAVGNHPDVIRWFGENNRWFVSLDAVSSAAATQDAITRSSGGDPSQGFGATLVMLRQRPGLLVLDNLETPWDPKTERRATEEILAALADIPALAVLASFRGNDRVGGPAWALVHPVGQLDPPDDVELFCRVAQGRFPNDPHLPCFMTALGGIPLAIELVAARAHSRSSLAALWTQWTRIGTALAVDPDFDAGRLTSLPHSIELSLTSNRLTPVARRLFCLLGQLPAGLAVEDRDELLGDEGFDGEDALLRIGLAVERGDRLDLLPPIRDHAARHHAPLAPDGAAWPIHYLGLARRFGETVATKAGEGAVGRLVAEFANIEAAIRAALAVRQRQQVMAALNGFGRFTYIAARPSAALSDLATACQAEGDVQGEATCILRLGDIALVRSDHDAARAAYEKVLPLYRQVGSVQGEATCILRLGDIARERSDYGAARTAHEQALLLYRQVGDALGEANCILRLCALERSDYDAAQAACEQALLLYRQVGSVQGEANCILHLGDIALVRSDYDAAQAAYEKALLLYHQVGSRQSKANCFLRLGDIALVLLDHDAARMNYEKALPLYRQVGSVQGQATCTAKLKGLICN